ncbi:Methyltransferase [Lachnellula willkommii]|uniref:Methyltransferase n=1 Tax=Lachnellula willkommii TaxID=215461 RepID=A0A559MF63_9HELO|nr:Methyltransferase [Lachnellula willkommii]
MAGKSDVSTLCDSFNSQALTYERRLGGSTRRVISHALDILASLLDTRRPTLLDNACGPGFATEAFLNAYPEAHVYAADVAPGMISLVDNTVVSKGWSDSVETSVIDGVSLHYPNEMFDASITNFGIFFFSDPVTGAREIYRTLKPGGQAIVTCWKEVPFLPILRAVQAIIRPGSVPIALPKLDEWARKETMEGTLRRGGFGALEVHEREVMWWNRGRDEAAKGFADNFVNMVGDQWLDEEKNEILGVTEQVLKEQGDRFVVESEGMIGFHMVAWIAVATKSAV